ncbi:glycosyltransferase family 2 protein [Solwaraspora sp. WMMA2080]|uniref:glycosyltransferase n=1 Tax=unclassified Solwaraspora TaxID=2627926 RepID=UPI00248C6DFA|nr:MULTISPECIES: glycosyltransferase family 2 protein [unclassified Solwaraspora]WBB96730.1 glycosyltransferase family 2 protein [Solwaraspora sp. WMMA2059]WBC19366.1 glycosyltransferase family 2 protein [Solwaraspora sp. WMMA2080]
MAQADGSTATDGSGTLDGSGAVGQPAGGVPRVVRNDWSSVAVPDLDSWRPTMTVSVVIPAYNCQPTLDLTLASLSRQTYPADLLEVVVADDGSDPPLILPEVRPARTKIVRVGADCEAGWGRAAALRCGVAHSTGEILHWLDADMIAFPEHVAAQVRWQHVLPYAVTLGYKRFVDPDGDGRWPSAETVARTLARGAAADLFGGDPGEPHSYVERYVNQTDQLRIADHHAFKIHVGATAALRRELYQRAGGFDAQLRLGEDTEFGYRLAQAGAVFVPEPAARSWHLGRTHVMRARKEIARWNRPFFADRIPYPRSWRKVGGTSWSVPLVEVVTAVGDQPLERVRAAVDSVLCGSEHDIRVTLVGPWDQLDDARVRVLTDPLRDLRLITATYRGEPRVRLATERPGSVFPAPYLLDLPAAYGLAPDALRRLIDVADRHQAGVVRVNVGEPGADPAREAGVRLWRTAALSRARWVRSADEPLFDAVTSVYGHRDVPAEEVGVVDLTGFEVTDLANGMPRPSRRRRTPAALVPTTVEVAGVRSLAKATVVVAWMAGRRVRAQWAGSAVRRRAGHSG